MVETETLMGEIHAAFREAVGQTAVIHAHLHGKVLEFAVAIGDTDRAHMVALREQQFHHRSPDLLKLWCLGPDSHSLLHRGDAGGQQFVGAFQFHEAEPAGCHGRQAIKVAEGGDGDSCRANGLQQSGA